MPCFCPRLTSFLGCEDVEEFKEEACVWSRQPHSADASQKNAASHSAALSSSFSKVFHPDYNVNKANAASLVNAYNCHILSVENARGRGMAELEKSLATFWGSLNGALSLFLCLQFPLKTAVALSCVF
ncbi:hypothetical protein PCASD_01468 [Puccinia coronata f. sp. avenae]|uniref:Uncharacterized protein n=1 Tax=Puccinia coronata f. sp. avenae TaxID=200324 RepID=A0A2N5VKD8_9BASI|nr:hypothetical protein PCASD_01468 [Puccinia coronata f. sp. avenae]